MPLSDATKKQIDDLVHKAPVVLFMKGNRQFPQCGFSAQVVQILGELVPTFETVNVLSDPALRDGIKEYSSWPTIPQLYVKGQFVGGCDIVKEMHASGELEKLLGASSAGTAAPPKAPSIVITPAAAKAFKDASAEAGDDVLRLEVDAQFAYELFFGPPQAGDLEVTSAGVTVRVDRGSAARADGLRIDYVAQAGGGGFKMENPNEPARVKPLSPKDLKAMLDAKEKLVLFDVRPESERALAKIAAALPLDREGVEKLASLDRGDKLVFHCHHGVRSRGAAEQALREGFKNVYNLEGGIDAWSLVVDPSVKRY